MNYRKSARYAAMAAACCLVSATAGAQSEEYRRGYEQGYRDGAEAQGRADRDGPAGRIILEDARYGVSDGPSCDARGTIQQMVGWRRHADIPVGNNLCGDPAYGNPKILFVRYRCGNSESASVQAPENSVLRLSCQ
ncbi:MAG TPA: hypothetical protein VF798_12150 [Burkholderiaceae bacterium]